MFHCFNKVNSVFVLFLSLALTSCGGQHIDVQNDNLKTDVTATPQSIENTDLALGSQRSGERFDPAAETIIGDKCLHAWREAIANHKKAAVDELTALAKQYPSSSTVQLMLGQVAEHFGDKKAAVEHYRDATVKNKRNPMYLFKLAESLRKTGDNKASITYYRELQQLTPNFSYGRLGLAKALLAEDKNSKEAKTLLEQFTKESPDNKEAKELLQQIVVK